MISIRCARAAAVLSTIAIASMAPAAASQAPIRNDDLRLWLARNHPNLFTDDARANAVLIVVDSNSQYVASVADSLPIEVTAAIDSIFASVGDHNVVEEKANELVAGRLRVPGTDAPAIYIVDGVRMSRVDSLTPNSIRRIEFATGADAAKFGAEAAKGGAIIVTTATHYAHWSEVIASSHRRRVMKLGIQPERVDFGDTQMRHVRSGAIGPEPLYVAILRLKHG